MELTSQPRCIGVITTVRPFDVEAPLIATLCTTDSGLSALVVVVNYPHPPASSEQMLPRSPVPISVLEVPDYLGSAEAIRLGLLEAWALGAGIVVLFDEDCTIAATACRALCEAARHCGIASANRNAARGTWVAPGFIRALRRSPRTDNMLCGWAGMAINLALVPQWEAWLRQLAKTLWFYWDDYTFVAWAMQAGIEVHGCPEITYYSPNLPRRHRQSWRSYYESRNAIWFATLTLKGWARWKFVLLWFVEYVIGVGIRDGKLRHTWQGFRDARRRLGGQSRAPE